jgi:hypothetical protein
MNTFGKAFSVLDSSLSGGVVANTFLAAANEAHVEFIEHTSDHNSHSIISIKAPIKFKGVPQYNHFCF